MTDTKWTVVGTVRTASGDDVTTAYFSLSDEEAAALPEGSARSGIAVTTRTKDGQVLALGISPLDALALSNRLNRAANLALEDDERSGDTAPTEAPQPSMSGGYL